jgi:hypothetical protein
VKGGLSAGKGKLGPVQATALAASFVVGSGILFLPVLTLENAGPVGSLGAWSLAAAIGLPLVAVFRAIGDAGSPGLSGCFSGAFGDSAARGGRLTVWAALVLAMPAMTFSTAILAIDALGLNGVSPGILSEVILIALAANHLRPLRRSSRISFVTGALLVSIVVLAVSFHLGSLGIGIRETLSRPPSADRPFFRATNFAFFGFVGWESLGFFRDELENPRRDLNWVYFGSFALVSALYLALVAVQSGLSMSGEHFDLGDGLLRLFPPGGLRIFARISVIALLVANLNAWVYAGVRQTAETFGPRLRGARSNAAYSAAVSVLLAGLAFGRLRVDDLFLASNQHWILIYGAILVYAYRRFRGLAPRLLVLLGVLGFGLLLGGTTPRIAFLLLYFLPIPFPSIPFPAMKAG